MAGYADSNWAGADPAYKSTSGQIITINRAPVAWRSSRQQSVAKSTTEAEYIAVSEAACDQIWLADLLRDAELLDEPASPLFLDNKGAADVIKAENITRRSRHIEIRYHLIRDLVEKGEIDIRLIPSADNKADGLTKPLPAPPFKEFRASINMQNEHAPTLTAQIATANGGVSGYPPSDDE